MTYRNGASPIVLGCSLLGSSLKALVSVHTQQMERRKERKRGVFIIIILLIPLFILFMCTRNIFFHGNPLKWCTQILDSSAYEVLQSKVNSQWFHGYKRVEKCGQLVYESIRVQGDVKNDSDAEAYADEMYKTYGSGFIDFQIPDEAFYSVDFGFTTFPSKSDCSSIQNSSVIYLSTMITAHSFRVQLLETFLQYYISIGLLPHNILLTIQIDRGSNLKQIVDAIGVIETMGVYYDIFIGNWSSEALMFHQAHKLLYCTNPKDWIVVADSDEFHQYPGNNITTFLNKLDSKRINLVNGLFLDRLAADGSLIEPTNHSHLFSQFSLGCQMHRTFNLGTAKKVMAFKGNLRINRGHHRLALCWFWNRRNYLDLTIWKTCPPDDRIKIKQYPKRLNVHHFKWMKGQYEATHHKAEVWKGTSVGKSYEAVLNHFIKCGGVCVRTPSMRCLKVKSLI